MPDEIHVWWARLDVPRAVAIGLEKSLSPEEIKTASRKYFERDKRDFIAAHGILRELLGHYTNTLPEAIRFEKGKNGKPFLNRHSHGMNIRFNMTHSGEYAMYSFCPGRETGIDIEQVKREITYAQIAERFYSQKEIELLTSVPEQERVSLFFKIWTRKEAFIKATGDGVSFPLDKMEVVDIKEGAFAPVRVLCDHYSDKQWFYRDISPSEGYVGALVASADTFKVICRQFTPGLLKGDSSFPTLTLETKNAGNG